MIKLLIMESGSFLALGGAAQDSCDMYEYFSKLADFKVDLYGNFNKISEVKSIGREEMLAKEYDAVVMNSIRDVRIMDAYAKSRTVKTKFIYVDRGNVLPNFKNARLKRLLPKMIARRYLMIKMRKWLTNYVAINADQVNAANNFFGKKVKITFIPITPHANYMPIGINKSYRGALFVGRLDERQKKISFLLKGVARVVKENNLSDEQILRIVGTGPDEARYKDLVESLGIGSNVKFSGFVKSSDIVKTYNNAGFFVSTSEWEGLSRTFLEAMACGLPLLINTNVNTVLSYSPLKRVVKEGYNGLVYRYGDLEDFSKKFYTMLSDTNARARFGKNALVAVKDFSEAKALAEYETIIRG
jgi:glycosyltransferase involved in cell wall biosynthesis